MDQHKLRSHVFDKTGIKIDVDDPIFALVALNEAVLAETVERQLDNCGWQARARIIIDTSQPYLQEGDAHDMARLASVDKVAQPNAIACE